MNPESLAFRWDRNIFNPLDRDELRVLYGRHPFANMQVYVTLRLDFRRIIRNTPVVAEQRLRLFHRGSQKLRAKIGW